MLEDNRLHVFKCQYTSVLFSILSNLSVRQDSFHAFWRISSSFSSSVLESTELFVISVRCEFEVSDFCEVVVVEDS